MTEIQTRLKEAVALRGKIHDIVKMDWFTTADLVNKSNMGHEQAKEMLNSLGEFAFLKTQSIKGKWKHNLIYDTKERNKIIEETIDKMTQEVQFMLVRIEYLKKMKNTSLLIKA